MTAAMLRFLTAGESHGPSLTVIIEGMPAGLAHLVVPLIVLWACGELAAAEEAASELDAVTTTYTAPVFAASAALARKFGGDSSLAIAPDRKKFFSPRAYRQNPETASRDKYLLRNRADRVRA